jgi:rod shape-determining protein MreD
MATIGSATVIKSILISFLKLMFPNVNIYHPGLISNQFLFELIANILIAPVLFKFLSFFNRSLEISTTQDRVDNV